MKFIDDSFGNYIAFLTAWLTFIICIIVPFILTIYLLQRKENVKKGKLNIIFGGIITELNFQNNKSAYFYYFAFMIRRLLFTLIVLFINDYYVL
jgi:hypothetical protein